MVLRYQDAVLSLASYVSIDLLQYALLSQWCYRELVKTFEKTEQATFEAKQIKREIIQHLSCVVRTLAIAWTTAATAATAITTTATTDTATATSRRI